MHRSPLRVPVRALVVTLAVGLIAVAGCSDENAVAPQVERSVGESAAVEALAPLVSSSRLCLLLDDSYNSQSASVLRDHGLTLVRQYGQGHLLLVDGVADPAALAADPRIDAFQTDGFTVLSSPVELTMSYYEGFWEDGLAVQDALASLNLEWVHRHTKGHGVRVAVLDTGVDPEHPLLASRVDLPAQTPGALGSLDIAAGIDTDQDGNVDEAYGHGTHVAGIIATIAPGATLVPIRVLDSDGVGSAFELAMGLYEAAEAGAQVANLSLVLDGESDVVEMVLREVSDQGMVVVGAAGNTPGDAWFPASDSHVFGVAASTGVGRALAPFSASDGAAVAAPGVSVRSAFPTQASAVASGTSMASAVASAAVALITQITGDVELAEETLRSTATEIVGSQVSRGEISLTDAILSLEREGKNPRREFEDRAP